MQRLHDLMPRGGPHPDAGSTRLEVRRFCLTLALLVTTMAVTGAPQWLASPPAPLRSVWESYRVLWPQRWGFFAEAPSEEILVVYRTSTDSFRPVQVTDRLMSRSNRWGAGRSASAGQLEARQIVSGLPASSWLRCDAYIDECANRLRAVDPADATNRSVAPALCGLMIFALERPAQPTDPPSPDAVRRIVTQVAVANVTCRS